MLTDNSVVHVYIKGICGESNFENRKSNLYFFICIYSKLFFSYWFVMFFDMADFMILRYNLQIKEEPFKNKLTLCHAKVAVLSLNEKTTYDMDRLVCCAIPDTLTYQTVSCVSHNHLEIQLTQ